MPPMRPDLVEMTCENKACNKTWKQLPFDAQRFHSRFCEEDWNKIKKNYKTEKIDKDNCGERPKTDIGPSEKGIRNSTEIDKSDSNGTIPKTSIDIGNGQEKAIEATVSIPSTKSYIDLKQVKSESMMQFNSVANFLLDQMQGNPKDALEYLESFRDIMKIKIELIKILKSEGVE